MVNVAFAVYMICAHIFFEGRVQGVFFRSNCQKTANRLGVNGWVRNLPDGRVEAEIEGKREKVEKLIHWCEKEQPHAIVTNVDIEWRESCEPYNDFRVRR